MVLYCISFTAKGCALQKKILSAFHKTEHEVHGFGIKKYAELFSLYPVHNLAEFTQNAFFKADGIIFVGACGIAVRAIAPLLRDKEHDPAVVVVDELGRYAISLLSGHIGAANRLACKVGEFIGATPIITTATDINRKFAIDTWASENNIKIENIECIKNISSAVLHGNMVSFASDFDISSPLPEGFVLSHEGELGVSLSVYDKSPFETTLKLIPPVVVLGIGCKKYISAEKIERIVMKELENARISPFAISKVCSINLKETEAGLVEFCKNNQLVFECFTPEELAVVQGEFASSDFVKNVTGVDNVCERVAVLGSGNEKLIITKKAKDGVTVAAAIKKLRIDFDR